MRDRAVALCLVLTSTGAGCSTSVWPHRRQGRPAGDLYLAGPRVETVIAATRDRLQLFRVGEGESLPLPGSGKYGNLGQITVLPAVAGLGPVVGCVPEARRFADEADAALAKSQSAESRGNWAGGTSAAMLVVAIGGGAGLAAGAKKVEAGAAVALSSVVISLGLAIWGATESNAATRDYERAAVRTLDAVNAYNDLRGRSPLCEARGAEAAAAK